ncbi:MAG TPA: STAS domain-containing protein [Terracidiphilus sp.]|jgi:anti-anti-sigma factor|nr:STAS domain-containing protein [Terracidiphilus sp.]
MTTGFPNGHKRSSKANKAKLAEPQVEQNMERTVFEVGRSGDWMPVEELREEALKVLGEGKDVTLNLNSLDHLDASALQILLALDMEQKKQGRQLHLTNVSAHLRPWFDYSGAVDQFFVIERQSNE